MTELPPQARPAETYAEVEDALLSRWPETKLDPTLDRIEAFLELLGDPQRTYPVIHLTGTNGKTSTTRLVDSLLTEAGLRTGRITSPHLHTMRERIALAHLLAQRLLPLSWRLTRQPANSFTCASAASRAATSGSIAIGNTCAPA